MSEQLRREKQARVADERKVSAACKRQDGKLEKMRKRVEKAEQDCELAQALLLASEEREARLSDELSKTREQLAAIVSMRDNEESRVHTAMTYTRAAAVLPFLRPK